MERRDEEVIVGEHARHRGNERGSEPEVRRDGDDSSQENEVDVLQAGKGLERLRHTERQQDRDEDRAVDAQTRRSVAAHPVHLFHRHAHPPHCPQTWTLAGFEASRPEAARIGKSYITVPGAGAGSCGGGLSGLYAASRQCTPPTPVLPMKTTTASSTQDANATQSGSGHAKASFWTLTLGSVGVVYGDIGTSPLYALKESLAAAAAGGALTREMVFGVVSLMLWALIVIVTLKYVAAHPAHGQQRRGRHA